MAATRMVASLMPVMEWFLAANVSAVVPDTRHVVPEHVVLQALMAGNGNMPLCLQGDGSDETLNVARGYNATNAGWGVLHWGVASGRGKWAALSPSCWALALQGQSQTSAESLANLAITGPASVERKRVHHGFIYPRTHRHWWLPHSAQMRSPSIGRWGPAILI